MANYVDRPMKNLARTHASHTLLLKNACSLHVCLSPSTVMGLVLRLLPRAAPVRARFAATVLRKSIITAAPLRVALEDVGA